MENLKVKVRHSNMTLSKRSSRYTFLFFFSFNLFDLKVLRSFTYLAKSKSTLVLKKYSITRKTRLELSREIILFIINVKEHGGGEIRAARHSPVKGHYHSDNTGLLCVTSSVGGRIQTLSYIKVRVSCTYCYTVTCKQCFTVCWSWSCGRCGGGERPILYFTNHKRIK